MAESKVALDRETFLADRQGKTFADVLENASFALDEVLAFFNDGERQRRMEESEIHHDRPPLAGVVRELEACPQVDCFLAARHPERSKRLRQAVGVIVRIVMEGRGWKKTGRKGSMGVRASKQREAPPHNTGGLAFWFLRAERYEPKTGMPFRTVGERNAEFSSGAPGLPRSANGTRNTPPRRESSTQTERHS